MKKSRNLRRISEPVSMEGLILNERQIGTTAGTRKHRVKKPAAKFQRFFETWLHFRSLVFKFAHRLFVYVPFFQDRKDRLRSESGSHQVSENAGYLLLIFGPLQAFAAEVGTRQTLLFHIVVDRRNRLLDDVPVHSLRLQVVYHSHPPEFLVVAAIR